MATPPAVHHALLRPTILHILRAAGYSSTKPSVLDSLTDVASRYMLLLASLTAEHAGMEDGEMDITVEHVRKAMQDCGALSPEKLLEDQIYEGVEDTRGVDLFIVWAMGSEAKEIRRIALEVGEDGKQDYLTVLKKKHDNTAEGDRYHGTLLGKPADPRPVIVEGGDARNLLVWQQQLRKEKTMKAKSATTSRRVSSDLSSIGEPEMSGLSGMSDMDTEE